MRVKNVWVKGPWESQNRSEGIDFVSSQCSQRSQSLVFRDSPRIKCLFLFSFYVHTFMSPIKSFVYVSISALDNITISDRWWACARWPCSFYPVPPLSDFWHTLSLFHCIEVCDCPVCRLEYMIRGPGTCQYLISHQCEEAAVFQLLGTAEKKFMCPSWKQEFTSAALGNMAFS